MRKALWENAESTVSAGRPLIILGLTQEDGIANIADIQFFRGRTKRQSLSNADL